MTPPRPSLLLFVSFLPEPLDIFGFTPPHSCMIKHIRPPPAKKSEQPPHLAAGTGTSKEGESIVKQQPNHVQTRSTADR